MGGLGGSMQSISALTYRMTRCVRTAERNVVIVRHPSPLTESPRSRGRWPRCRTGGTGLEAGSSVMTHTCRGLSHARGRQSDRPVDEIPCSLARSQKRSLESNRAACRSANPSRCRKHRNPAVQSGEPFASTQAGANGRSCCAVTVRRRAANHDKKARRVSASFGTNCLVGRWCSTYTPKTPESFNPCAQTQWNLV